MTESALITHARRELELIGEEQWRIDDYLSIIQAYVEMNHSGGSAESFVPTLCKLMQFKNLKPLTTNPEEWREVAPKMWQNIRDSEAFSHNEGHTYYLVSEGSDEAGQIKMHVSEGYVVPGG